MGYAEEVQHAEQQSSDKAEIGGGALVGAQAMRFEMTYNFVDVDRAPVYFTDTDAPDWLTSAKTVPGSTMDYRWFWREHVLTLKVGDSVQTDFRTIKRIA